MVTLTTYLPVDNYGTHRVQRVQKRKDMAVSDFQELAKVAS